MMPSLGKIKAVLLKSASPIWKAFLSLRGVKVGKAFVSIGRPGINRTSGSEISLGDKVSLCNTGFANPVAEGGRCRLATVAKGARIIVGDEVGLSSAIICAAQSIEIGRGTIVGGGAMIIDTDFHYQGIDGCWMTDPKKISRPVAIGERCFIGARAIILKGVTVGNDAVIGAGAVVSRNVEAGTVVAGNPAKVIKSTH